ncbi:MAG: matrixin family metalloprotease [Gammaproteobacteria bacterium]|nr:matrixin family metalloprotease [Gammaproteobacteria bacterium]
MYRDNILKLRDKTFTVGLLGAVALLSGCEALMKAQPGETAVGAGAAGPDLQPGSARAAASAPTPASPSAVAQAYAALGKSRQAVAERWGNQTFEQFEAQVPREAGTGYYIVDGDIVMRDRKHLREFFENQVQKAARPSTELIVHVSGGQQAVWSQAQKRNLTYCVSDAFAAQKATVENAMALAANAWENEGDVDFIHDRQHDGNCSPANDQVAFDVRPVVGQTYLARAFFPDQTRPSRNVLINDSAFSLSGNLSLVGILRHELGHTLGFRHEHTRPESGTCFEDANWEPLTTYDAFSVMHYPQCNGQGDWSLDLTAKDKSGVACLYGAGAGFNGDLSLCLNPPVVAPTPGVCGPQTVTEGGAVARGQKVALGPYSVSPGSSFTATMIGSGDPDLYVRFRLAPDVNASGAYDCRPYLTGANETCDLTVPVGATEAHVLVHGFTAGTYQLTIDHTPQ